MKIGIDARLWNETGVGRYIRNLVTYLLKIDKSNDYILFVRNTDYESIKYKVLSIKQDNCKLVQTDIRWHTIAEQVKLPQIINKENIDLMHFPYFAVPVFYKRPYVVTIHDLIIDHFPTGKATTRHPLIYHGKRLSYKYIIRTAAKNSKKIIAVSEATKSEIVKHLKVPEDKVVVTYEGVDEGVLSIKNEHTKYLLLNSKYYLYVGNAYPHKNLELLLTAFKQVSENNKHVKLILVGKEDFFYKHVEKKIESMGLKEAVMVLHDIDDDELAYLYKNALGLIMPSFMEGFGLPAVEAMALGSPVFASNIPSLKEICRDAAVYFDPFDAEDLIAILQDRITNQDDPKFKIKISKGLERAKIFSWEKMSRDTLEVYNSV